MSSDHLRKVAVLLETELQDEDTALQKKKKTEKHLQILFCFLFMSVTLGTYCQSEYILHPHLEYKRLEVIHLMSAQDTAIPIKLIPTLDKILVRINAIGYIKH